MMLFSFPRIAAALMVAFLLAGTHWRVYSIGAANVKSEWDSEKLSIAAQSLALAQSTHAKEQALILSADTLRKTKNAQIAKLDADLAAAIDSLHHRPPRPDPSDLSADSSAPAGCTGASLYRADAEFLARLTARADHQRLDLIECQSAYQAARSALN